MMNMPSSPANHKSHTTDPITPSALRNAFMMEALNQFLVLELLLGVFANQPTFLGITSIK